jgi:hypothetical protein
MPVICIIYAIRHTLRGPGIKAGDQKLSKIGEGDDNSEMRVATHKVIVSQQ